MYDLNNDNEFKELLMLTAQEQNEHKISDARLKRIETLSTELKNKELDNIKIEDLLKNDQKDLPETNLYEKIDTVNKDWEKLTFMNSRTVYENEETTSANLISMMDSLSKTSYPMGIVDVQREDTSTSEDYKETYTFTMEDSNGTRFKFVLDVPLVKDDKFLVLKGNDKQITAQLFLIPISKTDDDTVQIVSNYRKIFIRRFGIKVSDLSDRMIRAANKCHSIKIINGNNLIPNSKYKLNYEYNAMSGSVDKIETKKYTFIFNQDKLSELYDKSKVKPNQVPIGYNKQSKEVIFAPINKEIFTMHSMLMEESEYSDIFESISRPKRCIYARASILNTEIPVCVMIGYSKGLVGLLKRMNIKYTFKEKLTDKKSVSTNYIKFKDGYLEYETENPLAGMILNGFSECDLSEYTIAEMELKSTYINLLEKYGNRAKLADGLENFEDLMIDKPITYDNLIHYGMPTDYIDVLIYACNLLVDTDFTDHTDLSTNRYRSSEIVSAYMYMAISDAYTEYKSKVKHGVKNAKMTIKQSAVIDYVLTSPVVSDRSYNTVLGELEQLNKVTYKGPSGMNTHRAYKMDKRGYDKSMINVLGLSTNFAGNVGIARQMTIDSGVKTKYGYIEPDQSKENMGIRTMTATELMTPFIFRNDPNRIAMQFVQKSSHKLVTRNEMPSLITTGMDDAIAYMVSDDFAFKSKDAGKVVEVTDEYMIVKYKNGKSDYINLKNQVKKNSDGGMYMELKLDTDLKVGDNFSKNDIIAYDRLSFSREIGATDKLSAKNGMICKVALMNTDEGFEDSAICSDWLSKALSSVVTINKDRYLQKDSILLKIVKVGDRVEEGDCLLMYQNSFDEEDANLLMKNLTPDAVDAASDLGRISLKSKVTGWVSDIKVYRTVEIEDLSPSLQKLVNSYEKKTKELKKKLKAQGVDVKPYQLDPDYALPPTGKLKSCPEGVKIEIFVSYQDDFSVCDKLVYECANKGVGRTIFPIGLEPTSTYRPDEPIDSLASISGQNARMVTSFVQSGALNKGLIELDRQSKKDLGIAVKYIHELYPNIEN